tara:strand:+ start:52 stop:432 length:381 start_codon:yes stop_codon:yes gene_type:complete
MILLSGGDKYYQYSGVIVGDVSAPATIQLILIPNTGLRDSLVQIEPFFGVPVVDNAGNGLGMEIKLDDVTIYKSQAQRANIGYRGMQIENNTQIFVPRQSKLEIISLNTSGNNTQERGCTLIGYYL